MEDVWQYRELIFYKGGALTVQVALLSLVLATLFGLIAAQLTDRTDSSALDLYDAAPEPRPGPTGQPLFLAQLMKSATIRK